MRVLGLLLSTLAITSVYAQDSFCVKYTKLAYNKTTITGTDEYNLISSIVGRVVVGCDNNPATQFGIYPTPDGIFAPYGKQACTLGPNSAVSGLVNDTLNAPYFAGTATYQSFTSLQSLNNAASPAIPASPSIRFISLNDKNVTAHPAATGSGANEGLIQHLVSFFGWAFNCSSYDPNTNTNGTNPTFIGRYNGNPNMTQVHQNMNINKAVWDEFIKTFRLTLLSFGVTQADVTAMVVPVIQQFLGAPTVGTSNQICNQPDCACIPNYNRTNGVCVYNGPPTTPAPTSAPTTPSGNTTNAPTKAPGTASTLSTSFAIIISTFAVLLLALL